MKKTKMKEVEKIYRFVYWFGSITTDRYIQAVDVEEAMKRFEKCCGDRNIISIEEVERA